MAAFFDCAYQSIQNGQRTIDGLRRYVDGCDARPSRDQCAAAVDGQKIGPGDALTICK
jgi:hypothetical protein